MTMHTKELSKQEKEVVADLEAKLAEYGARLEVIDAERSELRREESRIKEQLNEIKSPFSVGDIVRDEEDVKYRVTRVTGSRPYGIRLNNNGAEAYKDPRILWSNKLVLVEDDE